MILIFKNSIKYILALLLILVSCLGLNAQPQAWQWAKSAGGISSDIGWAICSDANGNVFVAGSSLSPTIAFGSTTLTNNGSSGDIFIAKYDVAGNLLWAKNAGGSSIDYARSVVCDMNGDVFVGGISSSSLVTFGNINLTNSGGTNFFVVKYSASGIPLWAKGTDAWFSVSLAGISVDPLGSVYVTGHFDDQTLAIGTVTLYNSGSFNTDMFFAKYDASGNLIWAKSAGGSNYEYVDAICTDNNSNTTVVGRFASGGVSFGNGISVTKTSASNDKIFVVRYNSSGVAQWAVSAGGTSLGDVCNSVCADPNGNIFLTGGFFSASINFTGTAAPNGIVLANSGSAGTGDYFLAKYNFSGTPLWVKSASGSNFETGSGVCSDGGGNVTVLGNFNSQTMLLGPLSFYNNNSNNNYTQDFFIARYDPLGNMSWALKKGDSLSESGHGICKTLGGKTMVTGSFQGPSLPFGNDTLVITNSPIDMADVFIAKLDDELLTDTDISEKELSGSLRIFPNPFTTQTILQSGYPFENVTFIVTNCLGQTVKKTDNISGNEIILSRDDLPEGLYFIRLSQQGKIIATGKIIISG